MSDNPFSTPQKRTLGSSTHIGPSPPSNMPEFPSLSQNVNHDISDPVRATALMLGIKLDDLELSPTTIADVSEKSRDELANLFLQAEKVIRAREAELVLAANLGKTLLETNEALKLRHDALLSRLPVMQPSLPKPGVKFQSTAADQWITDEESPEARTVRPRSRRSSLIRSRSNSNASLFGPTHHRRISASPSALLALSETNAELIDELTRLRTATDIAQREGAARLRKLQREIGGLKAELEMTQRTNTELEERMQFQRDADQKQFWEERMQKLRPKESSAGDYTPPTQDFAPPGQGIEAYDSVDTPRRQYPPPIDTTLRPSNVHTLNSPHDNSTSSAASSRYSTISQGEYAVVTQLYHKVEELQRANKELASRNRITQHQLAQAERNASEIKRVYDTIRDELGADADSEQSNVDNGRGTPTGGRASHTTRGSRIDKSVIPRPNSWAFRAKRSPAFADDTITKSRRGLGNKHMLNGARATGSRARKPLTDALFVAPPAGVADIQRPSSARLYKQSSRSSSPPDSHSRHRARARANSFMGATGHRSLGSELDLGRAGNDRVSRSDKVPIMGSPEGKTSGSSSSTAAGDDDEEDHPALLALRQMLDEDAFFLAPGSPSATDGSDSNKALSRRENALRRMASMFEDEMGIADSSLSDEKPSAGAAETRKQSMLAAALVELWICLQFVTVILCFIYIMAKRGPRDVMGLPPRRG
ncbi:hypothetical protein BU17DRAFT_68202 [Hysterangium stoloniferum]|nr:hypothetical protein BU17DRAFT_68202 [Hysterangium stoloniferum]